jgi:hypothetical protein
MRKVAVLLVTLGLSGCAGTLPLAEYWFDPVPADEPLLEAPGLATMPVAPVSDHLAAGLAPTLHLGVGVSAVIPTEEVLENTFQVDLLLRLDVWMLQAEASVGWKEYTYQPEGSLEEGELTVKPFSICARYKGGADPLHFVAGGGIVWNLNDIEDITAIQGVDDSVGYKILAGVLYCHRASINLGFEAQYDFSKSDLEGGLIPEVDTSGITGRFTLTYHF